MTRHLLALIAATGVLYTLTTGCTQAEDKQALDGVWELESYVLPEHALEISGLLIFKDGHFAMTYNMRAPEGELSARSHSGTYRWDEDRLVFEVHWWVEEVEGVSDIVAPVDDAPLYEYDGEQLRLQFGGGGVQQWRRLPEGARHDSAALTP